MKEYKGVSPEDQPIHGGSYIGDEGWDAEVYNFLPYEGKMYGFVEAGWKPKPCSININRLDARGVDDRISGVLVVWVARHYYEPLTLVVGWYKNATVYRVRQELAGRKLPNGEPAEYFVKADAHNCVLILEKERQCEIPRGKGGLGQKNIWYADGRTGSQTRARVMDFIMEWDERGKL